jgi:Ca-activated chloride channel family protein
LFLAIMAVAWGQNERKVIRQGLRAYNDGDFSEAEVLFRKAGDINQESLEAEYNTGAALYGQEKYEETVKQYESLLKQPEATLEDDPESLAHIWHNLGNSLLEAQQYGPSMEAYKQSLRLKPEDFDTKYNLAYARQKLKEQQQQQEQGGKNDPQQDQQQNQQDQQDQQQNQQDQTKSQDDRFENQEQEGQEQQEQAEQQSQPQPREISKEDAERMLNAIQQQEKEVMDKVDKKKAAAAKVKTQKDW